MSWMMILYGAISLRSGRTGKLEDAPCPCDRWCASDGIFVQATRSGTSLSLLLILFSLVLPVGALHHCLLANCRIGEADHPGPPIWIGTTNPSGLRGKEFQFSSLPEGIWGISETHLAAVSQHRMVTHMSKCTPRSGSTRHFLPGAAVPLRARSSTEGAWAGVAFLTDLVPRALNLHWPCNEYSLGRVQVAQFWIGAFPITGANVYLWPSGPTWPRALEASRQLLDTLTKELVYTRSGPRFILGDFNHPEEHLPALAQWRDHGWIEVQELAARLSTRSYTPTFRGATTPDQLWLSPELAQYYLQVSTWNLFADHLTLGVQLDLPVQNLTVQQWPQPTEVPWAQVPLTDWAASTSSPDIFNSTATVTEQYSQFWQQYEDSFTGHIATMDQTLPSNHRGRGQRTTPEVRTSQCPLLRQSRPGEVQMATDFVGRAVQSWFKQLRRIQSLRHSVRAGKETGEAQIYRANLWYSIRVAKGFGKSFTLWWPHRPLRLQGSPLTLPDHVPPCWLVELLWEDFQSNYRKFESWHVRRRRELLMVQMEANYNKLFVQVKPPSKQALTHLQEDMVATIIGVSHDGQQIHLDKELPTQRGVEYQIDDRPAHLMFDTPEMARIDYDGCVLPGSEVTATTHYATFEEIDTRLRQFWTRRWTLQSPSSSDWQRILDFAAAYLPHAPTTQLPLDVESWTDINKRYTPRSAKGPDGVSRRDLQWMPLSYKTAMVNMIRRWEAEAAWPDALQTGFVYPLPKRSECKAPGDYRPVIVYSMVYRSWSSHRARRLLKHIQQLTDTRQFGFMPETDTAEMWMVIQAMIESACSQTLPLHGYVTDIQKAFENLPRSPILQIARQLGAPDSVLNLWQSFLTSMKRRFVIAGQIGEYVTSNHGFPEGCGLSCFAMSIVDISFHCYYKVYCQRTMELSYVDNLELMAFEEGALQQGIVCLQTWLDLWALELDIGKSYVWSTTSTSRKSLALLGWKVVQTEKDLGAPMAYGKKKATSILASRIETLRTLWPLLSRAIAPLWQKERILRAAFWPRAFYGSAICALSQDHLRQLRSEAMRSLGYRRAGASPIARLFLLCPEQTDPGYYHAWYTLMTFRRVVQKRPVLLDLWIDHMNTYVGQTAYGPFATLLDIFSHVGWHAEPPMVLTHDNISLDWLTVSARVLHDHFVDAWTQSVALQLGRRKDFGPLQGIDRQVLSKGHTRALPHQLGVLKCLQDGTFVHTGIHAKYDLTLSGKCKFCGEPDSIAHRSSQCRHMQHIYADQASGTTFLTNTAFAFCLRGILGCLSSERHCNCLSTINSQEGCHQMMVLWYTCLWTVPAFDLIFMNLLWLRGLLSVQPTTSQWLKVFSRKGDKQPIVRSFAVLHGLLR